MAGPVNFGGRNQISHLPVGWHLIKDISCECYDGVVFRKANGEPRTRIGHKTVCKVRAFTPFFFLMSYERRIMLFLLFAFFKVHVNTHAFILLSTKLFLFTCDAEQINWDEGVQIIKIVEEYEAPTTSHIGEEGNQAPISNQRALHRRRRKRVGNTKRSTKVQTAGQNMMFFLWMNYLPVDTH